MLKRMPINILLQYSHLNFHSRTIPTKNIYAFPYPWGTSQAEIISHHVLPCPTDDKIRVKLMVVEELKSFEHPNSCRYF